MPDDLSGQGRLLLPAPVGHVPAAGREPAAGRRVDQVRRQAGNGVQPLACLGGLVGQRLEQRLGVGVPRPGEERLSVGELRDPSGVHHGHPVGPARDHAEVVRNQDDRHAKAEPQVVDELKDLLLDGYVERRGRLVCDQQLRLAGQRHRDHHALTHAAGELVRVLLDPLPDARDADQVEHLGGAVHRLLLGHLAVQANDLGDLLADRHRRVQRGQRVLEDHADLVAADVAHALLRERAQFLAIELDAAGGDVAAGRKQVHDRQGGHGLTAAGFADDAERLARLDLEANSVDSVHDALAQPDLGPQVADVK